MSDKEKLEKAIETLEILRNKENFENGCCGCDIENVYHIDTFEEICDIADNCLKEIKHER